MFALYYYIFKAQKSLEKNYNLEKSFLSNKVSFDHEFKLPRFYFDLEKVPIDDLQLNDCLKLTILHARYKYMLMILE
jgi:hypothetical protein